MYLYNKSLHSASKMWRKSPPCIYIIHITSCSLLRILCDHQKQVYGDPDSTSFLDYVADILIVKRISQPERTGAADATFQ